MVGFQGKKNMTHEDRKRPNDWSIKEDKEIDFEQLIPAVVEDGQQAENQQDYYVIVVRWNFFLTFCS
jgi:hypothetical protein